MTFATTNIAPIWSAIGQLSITAAKDACGADTNATFCGERRLAASTCAYDCRALAATWFTVEWP